jgi:Mitochondrial carrier protein
MTSAAMAVARDGGLRAFFRGVAPRAASNGVNSAVFFAFFEALRKAIKEREAERVARAESLAAVERAAPSGRVPRRT